MNVAQSMDRIPVIIPMFDSIPEARKKITQLRDAYQQKEEFSDSELNSMITALLHVLEITEHADIKDQVLQPEEISDIGEQGLILIDNLVYQLTSHNLEFDRRDLEQVALVIARWVIAHQGRLTQIQSIVDGLAYLANALKDKSMLAQLVNFMAQVVNACSDQIKYDLDNSDPFRPWLVLNINCGIVATRSQNLEIIRNVYTDLIQVLPMDAPRFFKEGMSEMVKLNYPESVREVVQEFYERTKLPAIH